MGQWDGALAKGVPRHKWTVESVEVMEAVMRKKFVEVCEIGGNSRAEEVGGTPWSL